MAQTEPNSAYCGDLSILWCGDQETCALKELAFHLYDVSLAERHLCDYELLSIGAFSPLTGFMGEDDYNSVVDKMRLADWTFWPVPVCLDISSADAENIKPGASVALRDQEGFLLGVMDVADIWKPDKVREAEKVYKTSDDSHSGVRHLFHNTGEYYIGGRVRSVNKPIHYDFRQLRLSPAEVRFMYNKLGWKKIIGMQTRNPIHRPLFEMTLKAMRNVGGNLLMLPNTGITQPEDFDHYTRVRCYKAISKRYAPDSFILNLLPLSIRLTGPRDAVLNSIIAKNYGCTHFIVGPDHSGAGFDNNGKRFYEIGEAQKLATEYAEEIGIEIIAFDEYVYLPFEDEFMARDQVPENTQSISIQGSELRNRIKRGKSIPEWFTFPEIIEEVQKGYPPPKKQGFTLFLTGLSGAGKSTIAKILYSRFLEIGERPVSLLDGDIVRRNLSSELNFSKEHRDINVKRIGFVACEITKNRGIAICAPIAPYEATRAGIRAEIEAHGGFFEIHVATPIETCERRDRKGMYAKARAGKIKGFTGIDDPYESPAKPELRIDTTSISPGEAAQEILLLLNEAGFI